MARTRSKPSKAAPKETSSPPEEALPAKKLPPSDASPPKLFVLPKDTSKDTRIVTLDNPVNGAPSRYLFCPEKGFYEFTRIAAPRKMPRSWLITTEKSLEASPSTEEETNSSAESELDLGTGYITKSSDLYIATPMDILFLLLPALAPKSAKDTKQLFLSLDDHLDTLVASSRQLKVLLSQFPSLRTRIEKRMPAFCDTVDAGDESMYRLSHEKLLKQLLTKAQRMCQNGLPASMEAKFIKPALDVPILNTKREESSISIVPASDPDTQENNTPIQIDSQASTTTTETPSLDSQSTTLSTPDIEPAAPEPALPTPPEIPSLLRLRTSLSYLLRAYIPATLHTPLNNLLDSPSSTPSFAPLDTYLTSLAALRTSAMALRSISDNTRKRGYEDEEKAAEREDKKRKKEDEEKRKKAESRSIKQLKKYFFCEEDVKRMGEGGSRGYGRMRMFVKAGKMLGAWGDGLDLHVSMEGVTGVRDVSAYAAISITEPRE
ncbi:hypothetical protein K491DRAFT_688295, partial [Lophiostoma macrostomum CBS 122681]